MEVDEKRKGTFKVVGIVVAVCIVIAIVIAVVVIFTKKKGNGNGLTVTPTPIATVVVPEPDAPIEYIKSPIQYNVITTLKIPGTKPVCSRTDKGNSQLVTFSQTGTGTLTNITSLTELTSGTGTVKIHSASYNSSGNLLLLFGNSSAFRCQVPGTTTVSDDLVTTAFQPWKIGINVRKVYGVSENFLYAVDSSSSVPTIRKIDIRSDGGSFDAQFAIPTTVDLAILSVNKNGIICTYDKKNLSFYDDSSSSSSSSSSPIVIPISSEKTVSSIAINTQYAAVVYSTGVIEMYDLKGTLIKSYHIPSFVMSSSYENTSYEIQMTDSCVSVLVKPTDSSQLPYSSFIFMYRISPEPNGALIETNDGSDPMVFTNKSPISAMSIFKGGLYFSDATLSTYMLSE